MENLITRYRNVTILVALLFLQVLGLAVQVKRTSDAESTRLIRIWAVDAVTPFEKGLVWGQTSVRDLWRNYFYLRGVRAENRQLKDQIEQLRLEQVRLTDDAEQARRLQALLAFKEKFISRTMAAQVIGSSGSEQSRSVYIDKGSNDGIKADMAVITADGVVGKVLRVYGSTAQVLLINDQSSGVGSILDKSRLQGVVRGTATGEVILDKVMSDETVGLGETVLSSGGDQIFPKGLPVGIVTKVTAGPESFLNIRVRPAADLSRLEEVLVITQQEERKPVVAENGERVRAADILAQRLPSVPDQPALGNPFEPPAPTSGLKIAPAGGTTTAQPGATAEARQKAVTQPVTQPVNLAGKPGSGTTTKSAPGVKAVPVAQKNGNPPAATEPDSQKAEPAPEQQPPLQDQPQ